MPLSFPSYLASFHKISMIDAAAIMVCGCPAGHRRVGTRAVLAGLVTRPDVNGMEVTIVVHDNATEAYLCRLEDDL